MSFAEPRLLMLVALAPLAAVLAAWVWRRRLAALAAWASRGLWPRLGLATSRRRLTVSVLCAALAVGGVGAALARPRWGESREEVERRGVDVVVVLDTSLSMAATDVAPSRLWVAAQLVRRLAAALPGHRFALVQAEGEGVVMAPLTVDAAVLDLLLDTVEPGSLPVPGTQLAPALEQALRLFPADNRKHRVVVLLSDGEDFGGGLDAMTQKLVEGAVVVHAVGVGTPEGGPLPLGDLQPGGSQGGVKRDEHGEVVVSHLEEASLEGLARATDGVYLRAGDAGSDLAPIAQRIDAMERRRLESETVSTLEERFQVPLAVALLAGLLHLAVPVLTSTVRRARVPEGRA